MYTVARPIISIKFLEEGDASERVRGVDAAQGGDECLCRSREVWSTKGGPPLQVQTAGKRRIRRRRRRDPCTISEGLRRNGRCVCAEERGDDSPGEDPESPYDQQAVSNVAQHREPCHCGLFFRRNSQNPCQVEAILDEVLEHGCSSHMHQRVGLNKGGEHLGRPPPSFEHVWVHRQISDHAGKIRDQSLSTSPLPPLPSSPTCLKMHPHHTT